MEQYEGILFLTTNRAKSVDPAFQSRIDLILPYLDLTTDARAEIWKNFINHLGQDKFDVREEDIIILAEIKLNGREIKNLLKSAQYLMMKEGSKKVTVEHLKRLAKMRMMAQKVLADS
jgi:SpoVK/Ycf46/Vps4 family AAA+-type ATPase